MTQNKEIILRYIEKMDEEQIDALYFLISYVNGCKSTADLRKFVGLYDAVDPARPQGWDDKCRNELGVDPNYYAWSYQKNTLGGQPVNIAEAFLNRLRIVLSYEYPVIKQQMKIKTDEAI
jgi:hypothetical protein